MLTPEEMKQLADDIEDSDGLMTLGPRPIQLGIRRTAAIIAMLRDRRKYSLLESQFANCHKEIARLRAELLMHADTTTRS